MTLKTDDLRIIEMQELSPPDEVRKELPVCLIMQPKIY